jgi:MFS family permease
MPGAFYGWKLLAALWCVLFINLAFPFYGASVINTFMAQDFNLDRRILGLIVTVFTLTSGLMSLVAPLAINKIGVRLSMILGGALILLSALTMATWVDSGIQAVVMFGVVAGIGVVSGGALTAQVIVANWFVRRRALALSLALSAPGIGGFLAAPLLNGVISAAAGNWRVGWWLVAGLCCLALAITALFIKDNPASLGQYPDGVAPEPQAQAAPDPRTPSRFRVHRTAEEWQFREVIRQPVLWLMMFCVIGVGSTFVLFQAHGVIHLQDLGYAPAAAAASVALMSISTLIGNFLVGAFGDRVEPKYLWVMTMCSAGLAMLLGPGAASSFVVYPYVVALGVGFGGSVVCVMTLLGNYFGMRAYAAVVGCIMAAQVIGSAGVPVVAGAIFERYHTYDSVFYALALMCLAGALLLARAAPPRRRVRPA